MPPFFEALQKSNGDSRIFQQFREGKKDGPRKRPCLFRWRHRPPVASCREGAKRPADSNKSPNDILPKRQGNPCENRANGRGTGTERKCANLAHPRECRMKAESRFPQHFAVRHGTPCGRNPPSTSAPQGERLAKGQTGLARGRTPSRAGKALRSPVLPLFLHSQEVPCGKKVSSLRKTVHFFAESDFVFTAKKRPPGRRNAPYKQFFRPFFNSPLLFAAFRPVIETRKRKENLSSWQEIPCLSDNPARVL